LEIWSIPLFALVLTFVYEAERSATGFRQGQSSSLGPCEASRADLR
jgi:hypothetical protein